MTFFTIIQRLFFSRKLVKNRTVVEKHWLLPLVAVQTGEGPFVSPAVQIEELVVLVLPHEYPLSFF